MWQLLHICPSEEGRRGIPHLWCSFRVLLYPKKGFFICSLQTWIEGPSTEGVTSADSFTDDMSQSERFDHVYWEPTTHVVYIVIYLSHLWLYLHLRVQGRRIVSYQTTGAGLKRVLLSVPNLHTDTSNIILHNGLLISNSVLQSCFICAMIVALLYCRL